LKPTPAEFVDIATGRCLGPAKVRKLFLNAVTVILLHIVLRF